VLKVSRVLPGFVQAMVGVQEMEAVLPDRDLPFVGMGVEVAESIVCPPYRDIHEMHDAYFYAAAERLPRRER